MRLGRARTSHQLRLCNNYRQLEEQEATTVVDNEKKKGKLTEGLQECLE